MGLLYLANSPLLYLLKLMFWNARVIRAVHRFSRGSASVFHRHGGRLARVLHLRLRPIYVLILQVFGVVHRVRVLRLNRAVRRGGSFVPRFLPRLFFNRRNVFRRVVRRAHDGNFLIRFRLYRGSYRARQVSGVYLSKFARLSFIHLGDSVVYLFGWYSVHKKVMFPSAYGRFIVRILQLKGFLG